MTPSGQVKGPFIDFYSNMIRDGATVQFARAQLRRLLDSDDIDMEFAPLLSTSLIPVVSQSKSLGKRSRA
jgi:hypothetical protein